MNGNRPRRKDTLRTIGVRVQQVQRPTMQGTITRVYNSWRVRVHWDDTPRSLDYPQSLRGLELATEERSVLT